MKLELYNTPENQMFAKFMNELSNTPIDGHFWIQLENGEIIDPHFENYDLLKIFHKAKNITRLPASPLVQQIMIKKLDKIILNYFPNYEVFISTISAILSKPQYGYCQLNAYINMKKYPGSKIVFGSWGLVKNDNSVFWEFGGENWTIKQFLKM